LFVCTGNLCRSPIAAALLSARLADRDDGTTVESAGFVAEGVPSPREVIDVMWAVGLDISGHRSRLVTSARLRDAQLIIGMTRQHLVDLTVMAPTQWGRSFTLAELLRRGETVGARGRDEPLADWVRRVHAGRTRLAVLALPVAEDVPDPMGGRLTAYQRARDELSALIDRLAGLLTPA
jgi:protein-tyrosine phosphatase